MATYWYSTNGENHKRLSNHHTSLLDEAFDRRIRVQIYDIDAFGATVVAFANPFAGTMTAGDIHYGLYRHPSLWQKMESDTTSLDTLILMDGTHENQSESASALTHDNGRNTTSCQDTPTPQKPYRDEGPIRSGHPKRFTEAHKNQQHEASDNAFVPSNYRYSDGGQLNTQGEHCIHCNIS